MKIWRKHESSFDTGTLLRPVVAWKFIPKGGKLNYGGGRLRPGKLKRLSLFPGQHVKLCSIGYHASRRLQDAFQFEDKTRQTLALVELSGESSDPSAHRNKMCASRIRLLACVPRRSRWELWYKPSLLLARRLMRAALDRRGLQHVKLPKR